MRLQYIRVHLTLEPEATGWWNEPVEKDPNEIQTWLSIAYGLFNNRLLETPNRLMHLFSASRYPGPQNSKETVSGYRIGVLEPCYSHRQIPLNLAWASTIHRSQSLTLPQVSVSVQDLFCRWNRHRDPGVARVERRLCDVNDVASNGSRNM